jgi:N-acetylglucosaminyldiphosphoundecaprenol N-acetyl-beta-D-mannosaminyltransferase
LLGRRVPERLAGIDVMEALVEQAASRGWRVYLLGAKPDILETAIAELVERHPELTIAGSHHGYFRADEEEAIVREVRNARADIVFVAFGSPEKELFLDRHRTELGVRFAMGVGGAFDVIAGTRKRAPRALQRIGLEWAFRLAQEPRRLGRRYFSTNRQFLVLVAREFLALRLPLRPFRP